MKICLFILVAFHLQTASNAENYPESQIHLLNPYTDGNEELLIKPFYIINPHAKTCVVAIHFNTDVEQSAWANVKVQSGLHYKYCDTNRRTYQDCTPLPSLDDLSESPQVRHYTCDMEAKYIHTVYPESLGRVVDKIIMVSSTPITTSYPQEVAQMYDDIKKRYSSFPSLTLTNVGNVGHLELLSWNATALAINPSNNKVVVAGAFVGRGRVAFISGQSLSSNTELLNTVGAWTMDQSNSLIIFNNLQMGQLSSPLSNPLKLDLSTFTLPTPEDINNLFQLVHVGGQLTVTWSNGEFPLAWLPFARDVGIVPRDTADKNVKSLQVGGSLAEKSLSLAAKFRLMKAELQEFLKSKEIVTDVLKNTIAPDNTLLYTFELEEEVRAVLERWRTIVAGTVPCESYSLFSKDDERYLDANNMLMYTPWVRNYKAPGYFFYPGDQLRPGTDSPITRVIRWNYDYEVIPTGVYVAAGTPANIQVLEGTGSDCEAVINWQFYSTPSNSDRKLKWNIPYQNFPKGLQNRVINSPLGGLLWIKCSSEQQLKIQVVNALDAPILDRRNTPTVTTTQLENIQSTKAPWGIIACNSVVFVLPTRTLQAIGNKLNDVFKLLDEGFLLEQHLGGFSLDTRKREVVSPDTQLKVGILHSGYPIAMSLYMADPANLDYIFDLEKIQKYGAFGLFHEQGHNLQMKAYTFGDTYEVTCNIFAVYATEIVTGTGIYNKVWFDKASVDQFLSLPYYSRWLEEPGPATTLYAQLADHFGWELFRQFFREYRDMTGERLDNILAEDRNRVDEVIKTLSRLSGYNLGPLFYIWGVRVTSRTRKELNKAYTAFIPDDMVTNMSEWRVKSELRRNKNAVRQVQRIPEKIGPLPDLAGTHGPLVYTF